MAAEHTLATPVACPRWVSIASIAAAGSSAAVARFHLNAVMGRQLFDDSCLGVEQIVGCVRRSQAENAALDAYCLRSVTDGAMYLLDSSSLAAVLAASGEWVDCNDGGTRLLEAGLACTHCGCERAETTLACVCEATGTGTLGCPTDPEAFMAQSCADTAIAWVARISGPELEELHVHKEGVTMRGFRSWADFAGRSE